MTENDPNIKLLSTKLKTDDDYNQRTNRHSADGDKEFI